MEKHERQQAACLVPMVRLPIIIRGLVIDHGSITNSPKGYTRGKQASQNQIDWPGGTDFNGCLAHVDVTRLAIMEGTEQKIERIVESSITAKSVEA